MRYSSLWSLLLLASLKAGAQSLPLDSKATAETRNLYTNLQRVAQQGIMFGHQDNLAYGSKWKYEPGCSDVRDVTGEYPAVFGWELGHLELDKAANLDSVPFDRIRSYIEQVYKMGASTP
jgi:mannan endo-1,4-beta-mannosidase